MTKKSPQENTQNISEFIWSQKLGMLNNLMAGTAHTFNNILGGILGYSQLLLQELDADTDAFRQASTIEAAAKRATQVASQLHGLSSQKHAYRRAVVDPKMLVDEVIRGLESITDPGIRIQTTFSHENQKLLIDFHSIRHVLLSVCLNAVDAMPNGGELYLQTKLSGESPNTTDVNRYLVFRIKDTGCGIKKANLQKIFDPFFTTKKSAEWAGIGLTLANLIVRNQQGRIEVQSKPGQGSVFSVYLPIPETASRTSNHHDTGEHAAKKERVIMVVDDEDDLRDLAKTIFEKKGFKVLLAENGQNALKVFKEHAEEIDLVLLDLILPGMDGSEVYQKLKKSQTEPKIIVTSGYLKQSKSFKEIAESEDDFVPKPWILPDLIEQVNRLLQEH